MLLDITIVNVALPGIQRALHSSLADLQRVVDARAPTQASVPASVPRRRYDQNSSAANGSAAYVQTSVALPSWTCMTWTSLS
jgi:hypothetical protein